MSWLLSENPACKGSESDLVELVIISKVKNLGDFSVRRSLPAGKRQMVGPFIFFDQMGPTVFDKGQAVDVRPHPHIGLSTVTWLFEGEIRHQDSLGYDVVIRPGEVNWMTAGSGIVHSERSPSSARHGNAPLAGIQTWVALPRDREEIDAAFYHYEAGELPHFDEDGIRISLIIGSAWGQTSPVKTESETFCAEVNLAPGKKFAFPQEIEERAAYVYEGEITVAGSVFTGGSMVIFKPGELVTITADTQTKLMLLGGDTMDGPRYLYWNFVSSSQERIEQAKDDWLNKRFAMVAGDDEFIPLPDS